jgi:hypothetical protein
MFLFSSRSRDYTSVQVPCQIFVDRSAWLAWSIPHSLASDIQIHFLYLMSHTALLLLTFIIFCFLNSIVSYDQSIETRGLDDRFLIVLHLMFRFILYIWCAILHWCYWYSYLSALFIGSWVMACWSVWWKSAHLIVDGVFVARTICIQSWSSFHFTLQIVFAFSKS